MKGGNGSAELRRGCTLGAGCEADVREAREDGFVPERRSASARDRDAECSLILMIMTCVLAWYSLHCFISGRYHINPLTSHS